MVNSRKISAVKTILVILQKVGPSTLYTQNTDLRLAKDKCSYLVKMTASKFNLR